MPDTMFYPRCDLYRDISRARSQDGGLTGILPGHPCQPLPPDQQTVLAMRAKFNRCPEARDSLVKSNLRLVMALARKFAGRGLPMDDLVSEGTVGLIQAIDEFDPTRGARFSTFAAKLIRHAMQRAVGEESTVVRLPPKARRQLVSWRRARHRFESIHGHPPDVAHLARELGLPLGRAHELAIMDSRVNPARARSVDAPGGEGGSDHAAPLAQTGARPAEQAANAEMLERLLAAVDRLPPRHGELIRTYFGLAGKVRQSVREMASIRGVPQARVEHALRQALAALRREVEPGDHRTLAALAPASGSTL